MNELFKNDGAGNRQSEGFVPIEWTITENLGELPTKVKDESCKRVYAIEFSDRTVKIGCSSDLRTRVQNLSRYICSYSCSGKKIFRVAYSQPFYDAYRVEHDLHKIFDHKRIKETRELFRVSIEDVVSVMVMCDMRVSKHTEIPEKEYEKFRTRVRFFHHISSSLKDPDAEINRLLKKMEWMHVQIEGLSGLSKQRREDPDSYHKIISDPFVVDEIVDEMMKQYYGL